MSDGGTLGTLAILQGTSSLSSSIQSAGALKSQGVYEQSVAETNKKIADYQASDALKRGDKAVAEHNKAVRSLLGKQRASLAAQGIDISSGSAADIQSDTQYLGALDALTIKHNAAREAFGYQTQAIGYGAQGRFASLAANNQANNTLLTGGMNFLGAGLKAKYYFGGGGASPDKSVRGSGGYFSPTD